jgi:hypothetical protein
MTNGSETQAFITSPSQLLNYCLPGQTIAKGSFSFACCLFSLKKKLTELTAA